MFYLDIYIILYIRSLILGRLLRKKSSFTQTANLSCLRVNIEAL